MHLPRKAEAGCVCGGVGGRVGSLWIKNAGLAARVFLSHIGVEEDPQEMGKKLWDLVDSCFAPLRC